MFQYLLAFIRQGTYTSNDNGNGVAMVTKYIEMDLCAIQERVNNNNKYTLLKVNLVTTLH